MNFSDLICPKQVDRGYRGNLFPAAAAFAFPLRWVPCMPGRLRSYINSMPLQLLTAVLQTCFHVLFPSQHVTQNASHQCVSLGFCHITTRKTLQQAHSMNAYNKSTDTVTALVANSIFHVCPSISWQSGVLGANTAKLPWNTHAHTCLSLCRWLMRLSRTGREQTQMQARTPRRTIFTLLLHVSQG